MKKILLIVLLILVSGCSLNSKAEDSLLLISYQKEETKVSSRVFEISDEMQLVKRLNEELLMGRNTFTYTCENKIDLDEVIRMLSYLIPFDLRLSKQSYVDKAKTTYEMKVEYLDSKYEEVKLFLEKVISENITSSMSTKAKIDFAHDYILDWCEYDEDVIERNENNASAFQIQGVVFEKEAVCSGYSRCFLMMLRLMDIPCVYVPSDVINHSFNLVYDNQFRYIDVTWDEGDNRYYDLSKDEFFEDGKHELGQEFNSEYFVNFLSYIYHLN